MVRCGRTASRLVAIKPVVTSSSRPSNVVGLILHRAAKCITWSSFGNARSRGFFFRPSNGRPTAPTLKCTAGPTCRSRGGMAVAAYTAGQRHALCDRRDARNAGVGVGATRSRAVPGSPLGRGRYGELLPCVLCRQFTCQDVKWQRSSLLAIE